MTLACWSTAAHSMPAMIQESWPVPVVVEHLADVQVGAGGDALLLAAGGGAGAGDGGGDVRAVAVVVVDVLVRGRSSAVSAIWPARSGWSASTPVSSTATSTPCAGVAGRPGLRGADLRGAVGQVGLDLAVEPDLARCRRRRTARRPAPGAVGRRRAATDSRSPPARSRSCGQRGALDAVRGPDPGRARADGGRARAAAACGVGDDQRQTVAVRVVVAVRDRPVTLNSCRSRSPAATKGSADSG